MAGRPEVAPSPLPVSSRPRRKALLSAVLLGAGATAYAIVTDLTLVDALHEPAAAHVEQAELTDLAANGQAEAAASRDAFLALPPAAQEKGIAFLEGLVLLKIEEEG